MDRWDDGRWLVWHCCIYHAKTVPCSRLPRHRLSSHYPTHPHLLPDRYTLAQICCRLLTSKCLWLAPFTRQGVPALAILSAGITAIAGADTMTALLVASIVMGLGNGLSSGMNMTLGADLAPPPPRASQFLGVWSLICDAGAMIGPVIAGGIAEHAGMSTAAVASGAFGFVGTFWFVVGVKETLQKSVGGQSAR